MAILLEAHLNGFGVSDEEIDRACKLLVPRGCRHDGADMNALNTSGTSVSALTAVRTKDLIERLASDRRSLQWRVQQLEAALRVVAAAADETTAASLRERAREALGLG